MMLVETGMVQVQEPVTTVRLDTPTGLVTADVEVHNGHTQRISVTGVPSFVLGQGLQVDVPQFGTLTYDLVYGGNHSAILDLAQLGLPFEHKARKEILAAGLAIVDAVAATRAFTHPSGAPATLRHAHLLAPGASARHSRHAMVIAPGWFDRSPCGTGTAGRMAQLHAQGQLALDTDFVNESLLGTSFTGRLIGTTTVGDTVAVIPRISGHCPVQPRSGRRAVRRLPALGDQAVCRRRRGESVRTVRSHGLPLPRRNCWRGVDRSVVEVVHGEAKAQD